MVSNSADSSKILYYIRISFFLLLLTSTTFSSSFSHVNRPTLAYFKFTEL